MYIGLRDKIGDNQLSSYKWKVDDSVMSYSNFDKSQPSTAAEQCVGILRKTPHLWNDIMCNTKLPAVCEAALVSISTDLFF